MPPDRRCPDELAVVRVERSLRPSVAGTDLFNRSAPALHPAAAGSDNEGLTERYAMLGPGARFEGDVCALNQCRLLR